MKQKTKARVIAEKIMNISYTVGFILLLVSGSGLDDATISNCIAMLISLAFLGIAVFIERF